MVTQETASAFGTEMPRTSSSTASHKAMPSVSTVAVLSDHFTSCTPQKPQETPAKDGQMAITANYLQ